MSEDVINFIKEQKLEIFREKLRLGVVSPAEDEEPKSFEIEENEEHKMFNQKNCDNETTQNNNLEQSHEENKENVHLNPICVLTSNDIQTSPIIEPIDLSSDQERNDVTLEEKKRALIDKLVNSESPFSGRSDDSTHCAMLRYGEYSPNNPQLRVTAAPYLGLGEYEQRRNYFLQKQRDEYLKHIAKTNEHKKGTSKIILPANKQRSGLIEKSIQTDIQNIQSRLASFLLPKYIEIPCTERLLSADLYTPTFLDSFSYQSSRTEEQERERLKRDAYQRELRMQIEEKHRLQQLREEQERREQDMANRRLEQQLLRMQEERFVEEQRRNRRDEQMRRHSEDLLRRKQDLQSRHGYRKHTDSESSVTSCLRNSTTDVASKQLSHYSPPVSRRIPYSLNIPSTSVFAEPTARYNPGRYDTYHRKETLRRMDSLNSYDPPSKYSTFSRFDSLSRIDSLNQRMESMSIRDSLSSGQRRHSATQQDLSLLKRSPRLHRRSSSSRFDDALPVPLLKAHSPVAKELKNSVPFNSARHSSDAVRKLEDRWQIPAVQKNIVNHADSSRDGQTRSILTQLGAIRMQLQQEQLRMDESLRRRGITQSKAVDFH